MMPSFWGRGLVLAVYVALALTMSAAARPAAAEDTGSISGRVFSDLNGDGVAQPDELGLSGWRVAFGRGDLPGREVTTGSDGSFEFEDLVPGTYSLHASATEAAKAPRYWVFSSPTVTSFDGWVQFPTMDLAPGANMTVEVGIVSLEGTGSISADVYWDLNANGVRDPEEPSAECDCWVGLAAYSPKGYALVEPDRGIDAPGSHFELPGLGPAEYRVAVLFGPGVPTAPELNVYGWPENRVVLSEGEQRLGLEYGFAPRPESPEEIEPEEGVEEPAPEIPAEMGVPSTGQGWVVSGGRDAGAGVGVLVLLTLGGCCLGVGSLAFLRSRAV